MLENNLKLGDKGENVKILQEKLKILGFYNPVVTGDFGLATEIGVKAFQKEYDLAETGVVDEDMWQLLFDYTDIDNMDRASTTLALGDEGSEVGDLQEKLSTLLYYTGQVNSIFDLETENAVKRLQYNNGLTTTGIVNSNTWNIIDTLYGNLNECITNEVEENYTTYTVVSGDTLYSIAKDYNTTIDSIKELNDLTSNILSIGQTLKIPAEADDYITYTVVSGDTLYSIAKAYNTTVDSIKELNNLTSNILSIGQVLKIPIEDNDYITYTVVSGDTLYSIAKAYNTTVDSIKELNNLTSNILSIGQILKIPIEDDDYITYTVVSGDTLYAISKKYGVTIDSIKELNNLTSNILSIGQILKISI